MNDHDQSPSQISGRAAIGAISLNLIITFAEIIGGIAAGSLALLSDALHNFSDVVALTMSWIAQRIARQPKTPKYTFGMKRAEILVAAINAVVLVVVCVYLINGAIERLHHLTVPTGSIMIILGSLGFLANAGGTIILRSHIHHNLNLKSAYLHLLGDAGCSLGVVIGGIAIQLWSVAWIDPVITGVIAVYVLWGSYRILKDAVNIMMMGAPLSVSIDEIDALLRKIPGVDNVHHVHLWQLSETDIHFEAHVGVSDMLVSKTEEIVRTIESELSTRFGIHHVTIQCECDRCGQQRLVIP